MYLIIFCPLGTSIAQNPTMASASNPPSTGVTDATMRRAYDALGLPYNQQQQQQPHTAPTIGPGPSQPRRLLARKFKKKLVSQISLMDGVKYRGTEEDPCDYCFSSKIYI